MAKRRVAKHEEFSAGMYVVEGRLFSTRAEALDYCKAQRISAYRIELAPAPPVDLDPVKLSLRPDWTIRVLFGSGPGAVLVLEHASETQAVKVRLSDLLDLAASVKARVRELAKRSEP